MQCNKYVKYIILFILISNFHISNGSAAIVFQDNFDSQADWSPTQPSIGQTIECQSSGSGCTSSPPSGYSGFRVAEKGSCAETGKNTLIIDSTRYRGSSGKALTYWNEPCGSSSGSWGSDGQLLVVLPQGYNELYVRYYIKFQPGWQWNLGGYAQQKFLHVSHYGGGNSYQFFQNGTNKPLLFNVFAKWANGASDISYNSNYGYENVFDTTVATPSHVFSNNFYFGTGNYQGTGTDFSDAAMMGDGNWHSWEFYVKLNSAPGVADGIHKFWQDGKLIAQVTDLAWSDSGAPASPRPLWNQVTIGGNNSNYYSSGGEQWYALDDLVISTTYIGPESVPVGGYTQANIIPASVVTQATDGSGNVTIKFKVLDAASNNPITLSNFEYTLDGGATWTAPANGDTSAALSTNWASNSYLSGQYTTDSNGTATQWTTASLYSFVINIKHADVLSLNKFNGNVRFRFFVKNGNPTSSNQPIQTEIIHLDNLSPAKINTLMVN